MTINWALVKRPDAAIPDDILAMLEGQISAGPTAYEQQGQIEGREVYNTYLNSERGTAFRALMRILDRKGDAASLERRWQLIEHAATAPSVVLRAGAIEELLYLMHSDRARAVRLFERLVEGHPALLASHFAPNFVYNALYQHFPQVLPLIRLMMKSDSEDCRQRGAELACIAAISPLALQTEENLEAARALVKEIIGGEVSWRRGAARIFAHNITETDQEYYVTNLTALLDDTDAHVRGYISELFHHLRSEYLMTLRPFFEDYADSSALYTQTHFFGEYLWANGAIYPDIVLSLINIAARNSRTPEDNPGFFDGDEFVHVVLRVYTDPVADHGMRHHAMDVFDLLMERYPVQAQHALDEWDQR